jgi:hypothetical protein
LILDQWKQRINQLSEISETLHDRIEGNEYHGQELADANALMSDTETVMAAIDAHASAFDKHVSEVETFLGI